MQTLRADLSRTLDAILTPIIQTAGASPNICLIDPPGHANVGDSAILLGELDFLARNFPQSALSYYDVKSYSAGADDAISGADVILIHGGGNFGDFWPPHHLLRMRILDRFPTKKIIQLPQSIHFFDPAKLKETAELIAIQQDFTLMVRDAKNQQFAKGQFACPVVLAPDMAFAMQPIQRLSAQVDAFCLLRTDREAKADHIRILAAIEAAGITVDGSDWLQSVKTAVSMADSLAVRAVKRLPRAFKPFGSQLIALRRLRARQRVRVGIELLSRGRIVVTDRLHAHILSTLLGIPNITFDSYDGKISALFETWTSGNVDASLCSRVEDLGPLIQAKLA